MGERPMPVHSKKDMKKAKKMDTMIGARAHWRTINILSIDVITIRLC